MKYPFKSFRVIPAILLTVILSGTGVRSADAESVTEIEDAITKQIDLEVGSAKFESDTKEAELRAKYVAALKSLEAKTAQSGNLDGVSGSARRSPPSRNPEIRPPRKHPKDLWTSEPSI